MSQSLLTCGADNLEFALAERSVNRHPEPSNHWAPHGTASILLLLAGLEAWLNERVAFQGPGDSLVDKKGKLVSIKTGAGKCRCLVEDIAGGACSFDELAMACDLRDEIAHYVPYAAMARDTVPDRYAVLQQSGLFITRAGAENDYDFGTKLQSYALAYWCWRTVEDAASRLAEAMRPSGWDFEGLATNFEFYKECAAPEDLPEYDREQGIRGDQR